MSGKDRGESDGGRRRRSPGKSTNPEGKPRKQRSVDLGRALRSVYDDTLRETVPDEFLDILGKLS